VSLAAGEGFWTWSLATYDQPGVAAKLLALQDKLALNVNVLLWCCWMAERFAEPPDYVLRKAIDLTRRWSNEVTEPLRSARRALKTPLLQTEGAIAAALRDQVKAAEIESERIEQSMLAALAAAELTPAEGGYPQARRILARYAGLAGAVGRAGFSTLLLDDLARSVFPSDAPSRLEA